MPVLTRISPARSCRSIQAGNASRRVGKPMGVSIGHL